MSTKRGDRWIKGRKLDNRAVVEVDKLSEVVIPSEARDLGFWFQNLDSSLRSE
jgi:hypothetical protein